MSGFYITIKNGLLEPKHVKAMGGDRNVGTIWLFLWLLDKMTIIDYDKGEGKVLGGKPIKYEEVEKALGMSRSTYKRWIKMLIDGGYIQTTRTPYGLSITVYRAYKKFGKRWVTDEPSKKEKKGLVPVLNGESDGPPESQPDSALESHHPPSGEPSNKTINSMTRNSTLGSAKPNRKSSTFPATDYELVINAYQQLREIKLQGPEHGPVQQEVKTMFMSGRTTDDIIGCMRWLATGSKKWMHDWTIRTAKLKMPVFITAREKFLAERAREEARDKRQAEAMAEKNKPRTPEQRKGDRAAMEKLDARWNPKAKTQISNNK